MTRSSEPRNQNRRMQFDLTHAEPSRGGRDGNLKRMRRTRTRRYSRLPPRGVCVVTQRYLHSSVGCEDCTDERGAASEHTHRPIPQQHPSARYPAKHKNTIRKSSQSLSTPTHLGPKPSCKTQHSHSPQLSSTPQQRHQPVPKKPPNLVAQTPPRETDPPSGGRPATASGSPAPAHQAWTCGWALKQGPALTACDAARGAGAGAGQGRAGQGTSGGGTRTSRI